MAIVLTGCSRSAPPPVNKLVMVTGSARGALRSVGVALAQAYTRRIPGLSVELKPSLGLEGNADDLQRGSADVAFADSETTYVAYRRGTSGDSLPHTKIRAIGVLFPTVVHVFTRQNSGVQRVTDLRGKRIVVGERGSDSELAASLILEAHGLTYRDVDAQFGPATHIAERMQRGEIDAVVYYVPLHHRAVEDLTGRADVRLLSIGHEKIAGIQERTPRSRFLKSVTVPRATYRGQQADVLTVGEDILLLCRDDLPEPFVYDMTRVLFESVPELAKAQAAAIDIDPDQGAMTAIPLHPGAARYYRERELPK